MLSPLLVRPVLMSVTNTVSSLHKISVIYIYTIMIDQYHVAHLEIKSYTWTFKIIN